MSDLGLLGPLELRTQDGPRAVTGLDARILGVLAQHRTIGRPRLVAEAWGTEPRDETVYQRIARLRTLLAGTPSARLVTEGQTYRLEGETDLDEFRRLRHEAAGAATDGEVSRALDLYHRALGLWRGEPLAELEGAAFEQFRVRIIAEWEATVRACAALQLDRRDRAARHRHLTELQQRHAGRSRLAGVLAAALDPVGRDNSDSDDKDRPTPVLTSRVERLRRLSDQLADDLDLVAGPRGDVQQGGGTARPVRLSDRLFVERTLTRQVLRKLREEGAQVLLTSEAGEEKSSLLWGLYLRFRGDEPWEPILVSSRWLMEASAGLADGSPLLALQDLIQAVDDIRAAGRQPLLLLDTADLLLHNDPDRLRAIELLDVLGRNECRAVVACRPQEARLLPQDGLTVFNLPQYDTTELAEAVANYSRVYCANAAPADPGAKTRLIMDAVARGLPVQDVCLSPLRLRMLFEISTPEFPALELDVSTLYDRYWQHKVAADRRTEAIPPATSEEEDMTTMAERLGIAMLALGKPEVPRTVVTNYVSAIGKHTGQASPPGRAEISTAIDLLCRRQVLIETTAGTGTTLRFNHQTLFEYAAAMGLLARDGANATKHLIDRMIEHPIELFVGAVLEQTLVLMGRDPILRPQALAVVDTLLDSDQAGLQAIGLMVLARHPDLRDTDRDLFAHLEQATVQRFARIAPSVAHHRLDELLGHLTHIWETGAGCRIAVLEALERLARRDPAGVLEILRQCGCVDFVLDHPSTGESLPRSLAGILAQVAMADRAYASTELIRLFDAAYGKANGRDLAIAVLRTAAEQPVLHADRGFVDTATDAVARCCEESERDGRAMREALGELLAHHWRTSYDLDPASGPVAVERWNRHVDDVCRSVEADDRDPVAAARLIGLGRVIDDLAAGHWAIGNTLDRIFRLQPPRAPFQPARGTFPALLASHGPASDVLVERLASCLERLPATPNEFQTVPQTWAAVARSTLNDRAVTTADTARVLGAVRIADTTEIWLDHAGLAEALVPAAVGGHPAARSAVETLRLDPSRAGTTARGLVRYAASRHILAEPALLPMLIALCRHDGDVARLREALSGNESELVEELRRHGGQLRELVDQLLNGHARQQRDGVNLWAAIQPFDVLPAAGLEAIESHFSTIRDPRALANFLRLAPRLLTGGYNTARMAERLETYFTISGDPPAIVRTEVSPDSAASAAARDGRLELLARQATTVENGGLGMLKLATAAPTDVRVLGLLGSAISSLALARKIDTAVHLLLALAEYAATSLTGRAEQTLANRLYSPIRTAFRYASDDVRQSLVTAMPTLPPTFGRMVVTGAVHECFEEVRAALRALDATQLPTGLEGQIAAAIRVRSRMVGSSPMPQLLHPVGQEGDYPGIYQRPRCSDHERC